MESWTHLLMINLGLELGRGVEWEKRTEDEVSTQCV